LASSIAVTTFRATSSIGGGVDARYEPIFIVNLTRKLGELTFLAGIFIQNNVNSTCPLENIAMQEFELKWRATHDRIQGTKHQPIMIKHED
jgi:hypothetical protein